MSFGIFKEKIDQIYPDLILMIQNHKIRLRIAVPSEDLYVITKIIDNFSIIYEATNEN